MISQYIFSFKQAEIKNKDPSFKIFIDSITSRQKVYLSKVCPGRRANTRSFCYSFTMSYSSSQPQRPQQQDFSDGLDIYFQLQASTEANPRAAPWPPSTTSASPSSPSTLLSTSSPASSKQSFLTFSHFGIMTFKFQALQHTIYFGEKNFKNNRLAILMEPFAN